MLCVAALSCLLHLVWVGGPRSAQDAAHHVPDGLWWTEEPLFQAILEGSTLQTRCCTAQLSRATICNGYSFIACLARVCVLPVLLFSVQ